MVCFFNQVSGDIESTMKIFPFVSNVRHWDNDNTNIFLTEFEVDNHQSVAKIDRYNDRSNPMTMKQMYRRWNN